MSATTQRAEIPNDLAAFWLPFTPNRAFKKRPRLISRAKDMHYYTPEGREILDATAALWCCNAGHSRAPIVAAIQRQAAELDFSPNFQFAHPLAFQLSSRIAALAPGDLDHVFFANSGSEAADTALKIALAYHNVRGQGSRTRLIGRERAYHGVGFGGISVGGMVNNRKFFGSLLAGVDHLPATYSREHQAFTKGEPEWGGHLADALEGIVGLHDASTIAAVIVEPMAGSTGVLPAPKGYLRSLRAICDKYGILLIFDEVITGFGRLGSPSPPSATASFPTSSLSPRASPRAQRRWAASSCASTSTTRSCRGRSTRSNSSTVTPIPAIRSPVRRRSRRWTSIATKSCSSAPGAGAEVVRRADDAEGSAERARHPLRRPDRRDRPRTIARARARAATRRSSIRSTRRASCCASPATRSN